MCALWKTAMNERMGSWLFGDIYVFSAFNSWKRICACIKMRCQKLEELNFLGVISAPQP